MIVPVPVKALIQKLGSTDPLAAHRALNQWRAEHLVPRSPDSDTISRGLILGNEYLLALVYAVLREHLIQRGISVGDDQEEIYEAWMKRKLDPPMVVLALLEDEIRNAVTERVPFGPLGSLGVRSRRVDALVRYLEFQWLQFPELGDPELKEQIIDSIDVTLALELIADLWAASLNSKIRELAERLARKWALNYPGQRSQSEFINARLNKRYDRPRSC